jgi:hypothetical protein
MAQTHEERMAKQREYYQKNKEHYRKNGNIWMGCFISQIIC